jgi:hypothetical protein
MKYFLNFSPRRAEGDEFPPTARIAKPPELDVGEFSPPGGVVRVSGTGTQEAEYPDDLVSPLPAFRSPVHP